MSIFYTMHTTTKHPHFIFSLSLHLLHQDNYIRTRVLYRNLEQLPTTQIHEIHIHNLSPNSTKCIWKLKNELKVYNYTSWASSILRSLSFLAALYYGPFFRTNLIVLEQLRYFYSCKKGWTTTKDSIRQSKSLKILLFHKIKIPRVPMFISSTLVKWLIVQGTFRRCLGILP